MEVTSFESMQLNQMARPFEDNGKSSLIFQSMDTIEDNSFSMNTDGTRTQKSTKNIKIDNSAEVKRVRVESKEIFKGGNEMEEEKEGGGSDGDNLWTSESYTNKFTSKVSSKKVEEPVKVPNGGNLPYILAKW